MAMNQGDRRIAVVMITHNRVDELVRSLEHLVRLPQKPRIVLVDNASTDGTSQVISTRFPEVEVVAAGANLGGAARTVGVGLVDTPYVAFCDDDMWWEPGSLGRAADLLDAHPRLALVNARIVVGPEKRTDPFCDVLASSPLPREAGMPGPSLLGFVAGAAIVRRSAFLQAGGFEPRFFVGGEEELLAADLAACGHWICFIPELLVHHHPSPHRDNPRRRVILMRNALWFAWLRRSFPDAVRKTWSLVRHHPWNPTLARGIAEAVRGLPWALSRRRVLPVEVERGLRLLEHRS